MVKIEEVKENADKHDLFKDFSSIKEYIQLRKHLENKTNALWNLERRVQKTKGIEQKQYYHGGFGINNCCYYNDGNLVFGVAYTNTFVRMLMGLYLKAFEMFPQNFGTGNALDVIDALYEAGEIASWGWDKDRYIDFLKGEVCCYIVQKIGVDYSNDVLRIDLFRKIESSTKDNTKYDFTGGLFHVLKHFSIKGRNLSTELEICDIDSLKNIISYCVKAFAIKQFENEKEKIAIAYLSYSEQKRMKFVFFHEDVTNVYYLSSIHLENL